MIGTTLLGPQGRLCKAKVTEHESQKEGTDYLTEKDCHKPPQVEGCRREIIRTKSCDERSTRDENDCVVSPTL